MEFFEDLDRSLKSLAEKVRKLSESKLWLKVLVALFLGILLGILLGPDLNLVSPKTTEVLTSWLAFPGNLFLKLVKMIVIPLVFSSIILGILTSGSPQFVKKIGPRLLVFVLITTTLAIMIGLGIGNLIRPGDMIESNQLVVEPLLEKVEGEEAVSLSSELFNENLPERIVNILPDNPLASMVSGEMLGVVLFTIILGLAMLFIPEEKRRVSISVLDTIQEASMNIVRWAMELAPLAVLGLMTQVTAQIGIDTLLGLAMYVLTVLAGLFILLLFYNLLVLLVAGIPPWKFMALIKEVLLLAFSTSSSAAVMPLSIKVAEEKLGVRPSIARFLIPVGATINMDGSALYQSVAMIFLVQVYGIELSLANMAILVLITVGSSIGAPSAPGVGIVILATILETAGIPESGVALIIGVDRLLDMSRTMINVTGDLTACVYFDKRYGETFDALQQEPVQMDALQEKPLQSDAPQQEPLQGDQPAVQG